MRCQAFLLLALGLALTGCGQVAQDSEGAPVTPIPPPRRPTSTVCPSAPIDDPNAVALWTTRDQELVFVRHDGSELAAYQFTPQLSNGQLTLRKNGGQILALLSQSWLAEGSELVRFDTLGNVIDSLFVDHAIENAFIDTDATVILGTSADGVARTLRWSGDALIELAHGWRPIGVSERGFFAMRAGWDAQAAHGFLDVATNAITPFAAESSSPLLVAGDLVTLDAAEQNVVIHRPEGKTIVPLAPFADSLGGERLILHARDEGWVLVGSQAQWDEPLPRRVVVVDTQTGAARLVQGPADPSGAIAMYCDGAREGRLGSDGSVFFSTLDNQGLHVLRFAPNGETTSIGKPLAQIALLGVSERAGGYVVLGSDGSDTYCGAPDPSLPAPPGAEPGNSVHAGRVGHGDLPLRKLEFGGTWYDHAIDATGSCVLGPDAAEEPGESPRYRIDDLVTGDAFPLATSDRAAVWIE